jgi:hypothetical protein
VSQALWIGNSPRRHWPWTVVTAAVLVLQLGSRGDRIVVVTIWLALVLLPVERYIHQLANLRYVLLVAIALVSVWGNLRVRTGGGPFHIVNAGIWRGYPFMFEEWYWSQDGRGIIWHRQFHWLGFLADLLILTGAFVFVVRCSDGQ